MDQQAALHRAAWARVVVRDCLAGVGVRVRVRGIVWGWVTGTWAQGWGWACKHST